MRVAAVRRAGRRTAAPRELGSGPRGRHVVRGWLCAPRRQGGAWSEITKLRTNAARCPRPPPSSDAPALRSTCAWYTYVVLIYVCDYTTYLRPLNIWQRQTNWKLTYLGSLHRKRNFTKIVLKIISTNLFRGKCCLKQNAIKLSEH